MSRSLSSSGRSRGSSKAVCVILGIVAALLVAAYGMRVWYVNAHPVEAPIPVEHHVMGEWVNLDGTYLFADYQSPEGYSVRVSKAELLTPNEFIDLYGAEGSQHLDSDEGDVKSVVSLEVEIEHVGDGEVGIVLFEQRLIPERKNVAYRYDDELWWMVEPSLKDNPGMFSLLPDTTYVTHIPFTYTTNPDLMESYDKSPRMEIADTSFEYLLSNEPVKTVVDIEL